MRHCELLEARGSNSGVPFDELLGATARMWVSLLWDVVRNVGVPLDVGPRTERGTWVSPVVGVEFMVGGMWVSQLMEVDSIVVGAEWPGRWHGFSASVLVV